MIKPIGERVLVKRIKIDEVTMKSGIYLTYKAASLIEPFEVLAIGEDMNEALLGKQVIINKYSGAHLEDGLLVIVDAKDIIGFYEPQTETT